MEAIIITAITAVVYPASMYLLPASIATKINFGLKLVGKAIEKIDEASKTKAGFSNEKI
jgi:hypothetical protein